MSKHWNIWDIRNKYLRAAVAWPLAIGCGVAFIVAAPFVLLFLAGVGVYDGVRSFAYRITDYEWRELARTAWRAMTAREVV